MAVYRVKAFLFRANGQRGKGAEGSRGNSLPRALSLPPLFDTLPPLLFAQIRVLIRIYRVWGWVLDSRLSPIALEAIMGVLPDHWITKMAKKYGMIEPFADNRARRAKISYGVSSYGYDFRLADEFKILDFDALNYLDPKRMDKVRFRSFQGKVCIIAPNSFVLARSHEYFRIPRDVLVLCQGKSTYARCGLVLNVTPFEPEWEGFATISLINGAPVPICVHAGEGIAQIIFIRAESECVTSYADRRGKYQAQKKIEPSRV